MSAANTFYTTQKSVPEISLQVSAKFSVWQPCWRKTNKQLLNDETTES
jgi:hypothetical protein